MADISSIRMMRGRSQKVYYKEHEERKMRKIGVNLLNFPEVPVEERIKFMSEIGFEATFTGMGEEKDTEQNANLFAKYNIAYEAVHAPFRPINDIWLDNEVGEEVYQRMLDCVDYCVKFNVPTMVIHMSSGLTPPPVTDLGRERYTAIIEYAEKKGIVLAFENLRKLAHLAWVFEEFKDHDTVKMCWDCGHETCYTPQYEFMPMFGHKLAALHIHDNYGILNQDDHLLPFDGVTDFNRVARQIKQSGYEGSIMLEVMRGSHERYANMSFEEYAIKAVEAAKRIRI